MSRKEIELRGDVMVTTKYDRMIAEELERRRGFFVTNVLNRERAELGNKKFEEKRTQLAEEATRHWDLAQEGKRHFRELEEASHREIMNWKELEKPLRQWLENQAVGEGWSKEMVERTIISRRKDFERAQKKVEARLRPKVDPNIDFRQRVLNSATREEALKHYLLNHVNRSHFIMEAIKLLFELSQKRR